jgi:threonine/homoserine efflux transporter RhtA
VGIVAALLLKPLGWLITGGHYALSAVAVIGWAVYLATWAATLPYVTEIVARQRSRDVFVVRLVDSVLGAAAALVVLAFGLGYPWVPWGMSIGGVVAAVWLRRIALRTRPGAVAAGRHRVRRVAA